MRYFAVGFKDWAEIRAARVPPRKKETSVSRMGMTPRPRYWDGPWVATPSKYTIKTVAHVGGKVITMVPANEFRKYMKVMAPTHGNMLEIKDSTQLAGLKEIGRKYN